MGTLIISSSLSKNSKSFILGKEIAHQLQKKTHAELIDLKDYPLPFCDAGSSYSDANVHLLSEKILNSDGIILCVPIYNYSINAVAKNLIELTGRNWTGKTVAFACAAGGKSSYMSIMSTANSLMLDFRCVIVPRFIYSNKEDFKESSISSNEIKDRIALLCEEYLVLSSKKK